MGKDLNLIDLSKLETKSKEYKKANRHNTALRKGFKDHNQYMRYKNYIKNNPKSNRREFLILEKNKKKNLEDVSLIDLSQFGKGSLKYNKAIQHNTALRAGFKDINQYNKYKKYIRLNPSLNREGFLALEKRKEENLKEMNLIDLTQFEYKSTEYNRAVNDNTALRAGFEDINQYGRYKNYIKNNPKSNKEEFLKMLKNIDL